MLDHQTSSRCSSARLAASAAPMSGRTLQLVHLDQLRRWAIGRPAFCAEAPPGTVADILPVTRIWRDRSLSKAWRAPSASWSGFRYAARSARPTGSDSAFGYLDIP